MFAAASELDRATTSRVSAPPMWGRRGRGWGQLRAGATGVIGLGERRPAHSVLPSRAQRKHSREQRAERAHERGRRHGTRPSEKTVSVAYRPNDLVAAVNHQPSDNWSRTIGRHAT